MDAEPDHWLAPGYREHLWNTYRRGTSSPVRPADWLYPLDHPWADFFAGTCSGEQVLIGPYFPSLVACFFSQAGDLLRVEERRQSDADPAPDPVRDPMYLEILKQIPPADPVGMLQALAWFNRPVRQAWDWARELGVEFGPVRLRQFSLPDKRIGIEDGNRLGEDGIWDDAEASAEEWLRSGKFVFWWSRDLWVDGEGKIFAT